MSRCFLSGLLAESCPGLHLLDLFLHPLSVLYTPLLALLQRYFQVLYLDNINYSYNYSNYSCRVS